MSPLVSDDELEAGGPTHGSQASAWRRISTAAVLALALSVLALAATAAVVRRSGSPADSEGLADKVGLIGRPPPGGQRRQLRLQLDPQRQLPAAGRLRCGVPRCEPVLDVVRFLIGASPGQRRRLPVQLDPQRQLPAAGRLRCGVPRREPVGSVYEVSEPLIALNC